jgi:hypothetical protein
MAKLFSIVLFFISIINTVSAQISEQYIVAAPTATMRSGEGKQYASVATLSKNDVVQVLKTNTNGWWYVDFNGTEGFVISQFLKKRSNDGWITKKYETGDTPDCDNVKAEYDLNLDNHLKVTVNSNSDVVVKLMKKQTTGDICIRTVYIESSDFTLIKNIPEGKYYLKIAYGLDWRQKKIGGKCIGRFVENAQYEIGQERLNYKIIQMSNRVDIPSYSLTLGNKAKEGVDATFNTNQISEAEFNN